MKRCKILKKILLACSICTLMNVQNVFAQKGGNEECYTYTVTLYSGKQGTFLGEEGIQVDNHLTGSDYQILEEQKGGEKIKISGLKLGDIVVASAPSNIKMEDTSRYYVKGIRESGRDNSTVGESAFRVDADKEYVVAYGIKGDMVSYTVNYQDEEGNTLAESQQFYGTVGDQPVVAFRYIENYQPQAYNLTKTLSRNEADNVFTFVYKKTIAQTEENGTNSTNAEAVGGQLNNNTTNGGNNNNNDMGVDNTGTEENGENNGENNGGNEIGEEQQTPQELVNLDDEETPLANIKNTSAKPRTMKNMLLFLGIGVAAIAALGVLVTVLFKKKKKNNKAENKSESKKQEKGGGNNL